MADTSPIGRIQTELRLAEEHLAAAARIADETCTGFFWNFDGYDCGGRYVPVGLTRDRAIALIESGSELSTQTRRAIVDVLKDGSDWESSESQGWISSSADC